MARHAWKPFLQRWSEEWRIAHPGEEPEGDPWFGCSPATEDEVQDLEVRLGCALPPSFREFLLVTNGWRHAGNFVRSLRGTGEIGWLADLEPMWARTYVDWDVEYEEPAAGRSLPISLEADAGVVYLDPGDVDERGEWAAYDVFSWTAIGPERHGSFYEKMYDFDAGFHALDRPRCETQREWDAKVEDARLASLRGEVDRPLSVFAQAKRFGRDRASFLRFQMQTRRFGSGSMSQLPRDRGSQRVEYQFPRDRGSQRVKYPLGRHQAQREETRFQVCFGNPEFDMAVHAAHRRR